MFSFKNLARKGLKMTAEDLVPPETKASPGTVKCRYNAVFGVQEIDRVIAVTAL